MGPEENKTLHQNDLSLEGNPPHIQTSRIAILPIMRLRKGLSHYADLKDWRDGLRHHVELQSITMKNDLDSYMIPGTNQGLPVGGT
jgi:hypothetical protein